MLAPVKLSEINKVSDLLGDKWTKLGVALLIDAEDIDYYASEEGDHAAKCQKMLTVWAVSL